jgi:putative peptide zinc metalloprotease protein
MLSIIVFLNYDEIYKNLKDSSVENIFLYVGIMIISSLFHELGHTTATYKFGGDHSGIGVGFYLFTPVLYADVSSTWKFEANKRIVVNLAGIYFELLLCTLLILVSLIIGFKPLMTISMMILIKTLFNLNPFFRTDGYWVLSDAIRIPNLRTTSNELLKRVIKQLNFNLTKKQFFF